MNSLKNLVFEVRLGRLHIVRHKIVRLRVIRLCVLLLDFEILVSDFWRLIKQTLDFILSH